MSAIGLIHEQSIRRPGRACESQHLQVDFGRSADAGQVPKKQFVSAQGKLLSQCRASRLGQNQAPWSQVHSKLVPCNEFAGHLKA